MLAVNAKPSVITGSTACMKKSLVGAGMKPRKKGGLAPHVETGNQPSSSANIQIRIGPNTRLGIDSPNTATKLAE